MEVLEVLSNNGYEVAASKLGNTCQAFAGLRRELVKRYRTNNYQSLRLNSLKVGQNKISLEALMDCYVVWHPTQGFPETFSSFTIDVLDPDLVIEYLTHPLLVMKSYYRLNLKLQMEGQESLEAKVAELYLKSRGWHRVIMLRMEIFSLSLLAIFPQDLGAGLTINWTALAKEGNINPEDLRRIMEKRPYIIPQLLPHAEALFVSVNLCRKCLQILLDFPIDPWYLSPRFMIKAGGCWTPQIENRWLKTYLKRDPERFAKELRQQFPTKKERLIIIRLLPKVDTRCVSALIRGAFDRETLIELHPCYHAFLDDSLDVFMANTTEETVKAWQLRDYSLGAFANYIYGQDWKGAMRYFFKLNCKQAIPALKLMLLVDNAGHGLKHEGKALDYFVGQLLLQPDSIMCRLREDESVMRRW